MIIQWPKYLIDNITRAGQALINKFQSLVDSLQSEIDTIYDLSDPYRCPEKHLPNLSVDLHAEIGTDDTVRTKRLKCANAIEQGKNKSLWELDLKLRVENVFGAPVSLYSRRTTETLEDAIFWGGQETRTRRWSVFGTTGDVGITARGELFVGVVAGIPYTEDFLPGMICINLGSSQGSTMLNKIKLAINQNGGYVGHRIFIGYLTGTVFTVQDEA